MSNVLVVDDSMSMRQMVAATLTKANHSVSLAEHGQDGLAQAKSKAFDLIITDMNMPVMDGIGLVTQVRKIPEYKFTPILILTTEASTDKKMAGKDAGATGWVVKPFEPDELLRLISRVIN